ncbi:MAG: hypothetical protein HY436_01240 [Candidatus Liptonbacteria bacterium]|nr:hypothetical protein [Candidatus Liptonbacteria bacterium]
MIAKDPVREGLRAFIRYHLFLWFLGAFKLYASYRESDPQRARKFRRMGVAGASAFGVFVILFVKYALPPLGWTGRILIILSLLVYFVGMARHLVLWSGMERDSHAEPPARKGVTGRRS